MITVSYTHLDVYKRQLWDIAKKFYTTVEEISAVNELKDGEISVGQPLLLIKKVEQ